MTTTTLLSKLLNVTLEDYIQIIVASLIVFGAFSYAIVSNPNFGAQSRFVARQQLGSFVDSKSADFTFTYDHADQVNDISSTSFGYNATGDERLFCFKVDDGVVTEFRFVDNITESKREAVAGKCSSVFSNTEFDGFLHTQPDYSDELSEEDKDLESPNLDYTCIAFDKIVEITEEVGGVKCWRITGSEPDFNFTQVEVGLSSKSEILPP